MPLHHTNAIAAFLGSTGAETQHGYDAKYRSEVDESQHLSNCSTEVGAKDHQFVEAGIAQPCGVILAMNCIHFGVMKRGHQQRLRGASTNAVTL